MGVIRRQMSIKSDLQTSALVNYHTQDRPRIGLSFRWKVESVHIGHYYSHLVSKSYDLTLILFHKTAGEESKMIDKNNTNHNVLIKWLRKQHPSPSSPTSSLVQQTCLTPIWRAGTALISISVFLHTARLEILLKYICSSIGVSMATFTEVHIGASCQEKTVT